MVVDIAELSPEHELVFIAVGGIRNSDGGLVADVDDPRTAPYSWVMEDPTRFEMGRLTRHGEDGYSIEVTDRLIQRREVVSIPRLHAESPRYRRHAIDAPDAPIKFGNREIIIDSAKLLGLAAMVAALPVIYGSVMLWNRFNP